MRIIILITVICFISVIGNAQTMPYAKCIRSAQADSLNLTINNLLKANIVDYHADKWCDVIKNKYANIWILPIGIGVRRELILTIPIDTIPVQINDTNYFENKRF